MNNHHSISLGVYLFSYNKGIFLRNCIDSLKICAGDLPKFIVDDGSTDPTTLSVLQNETEGFSSLKPQLKESENTQLGGLYNNMAMAFDDARSRKLSHVLFIQDDMQLVRPITEQDMHNIELYFETHKDSAQLQSCFMKLLDKEINEKHYISDPVCRAYLPKDDHPGYAGFSDVGIFCVDRFYDLLGQVLEGEAVNNNNAKRLGVKLGILSDPFMMWLPYPISYRKKRRSVKIRVTEFMGQCGFYPIVIMSEKHINKLIFRNVEHKPYAEDWLACTKNLHAEHWSFSGGAINLFARGGVRKKIALLLWRL